MASYNPKHYVCASIPHALINEKTLRDVMHLYSMLSRIYHHNPPSIAPPDREELASNPILFNILSEIAVQMSGQPRGSTAYQHMLGSCYFALYAMLCNLEYRQKSLKTIQEQIPYNHADGTDVFLYSDIYDRLQQWFLQAQSELEGLQKYQKSLQNIAPAALTCQRNQQNPAQKMQDPQAKNILAAFLQALQYRISVRTRNIVKEEIRKGEYTDYKNKGNIVTATIRAVRDKFSLDALDAGDDLKVDALIGDLVEDIDTHENRQRVTEAMKDLENDEQELVRFTYLDGHKLSERHPVKTPEYARDYRTLQKALKKLREKLV